ncbi:SDR family NAD(P)-dependent oxidoreductase [Priestia megaterium]
MAFIEAACIAAETASEKKVSRLSNVIWTNPIISDETQKEIFIKLTPNQSELDYEITSMNQNDEHILHGQGKISFKGSSEFLDKKEFVNINEVKERCNGLLLGDELYPKLDDLGLSLGKSFRAIQELRYSSNEALSFLSLPSHLLKDYKKFKLHPSIMDAALQTALGLLNKNNELDVLKIPFSIGEVQILGDIPHHCYSYVVKDKDSDSKQSINKFIVYILDLEGRVRIKIKDFVVRPFQQHRLTINNNTILEKSSTSYFRTVWEKYNPENLTNEGLEGNILLFGKSTDLYHRLTEKISKESKFKVILVRPGHGYCKLDNMYEINPDNKEDYKRLIDDLINSHIMPHKIIHMWSEQLFIQNGEHVNQQLAEGLFSLLYLSKALNENKSEKKIEIIYAFNGRNDQQPLYAAVSGFAKTLRLENPKLQLKTVDLQNSPYDISITKLIDILLQRNFMKDENILEIKCKGDEFLVKKRKETNVIEPDDTSTLLKNNGVYLITGGAGGLGLVIAKYLAQKIQANIILCGRSELDVDKKEKIEKIKILGSKVSYIKCDISNYDEVERLITKIKSKFNKINGVIHSAGIIRDSLIDNKTISEMKEVLAPKVLGAINLDNALKDDEIDFFVLFSSITALFGNIGQSDYAYANSFLDNFSSFRDYKKNKKERYGKTISINWPYWSEGGMSMDAHTQELLDNIMGLKAMTTETGLQAFNQAILSNEKQLVVIEGNKDKIQRNSELLFGSSKEPLDPNTDFIVEREILNQVDKLEKLDGALAFEIGNNDIDNDMVLEKLQHDLVKQVSVLLKMTEKNIDVKKDFNNYGFDSISFIKLSNNINKKYNLDITPASFFEYSNLESFSLYLFDAYGEKFVNHYQKSMETEKVSLEITNDSNREKYFNLDKNHEEINEAETIETTMSKEPIAIVGIGGKMPQSVNLEDFWGNLIKGKDLITEIPSDRWNWKDYYGDPIKENNKTNVIRGGFIKDADKFDAEFFNISSIEAKLMDPQQRIFLETVWETIENAGYQASQLSGTKTGLFVGVSTSDYLELLKENNVDIKAYTTTGSFHSILANRISYLLNLKGPSVPVDTACSSSLVALRQAMEAIWSGSCEMAIVGGVNLMFTPTISISFSKAGMLSTDGKCKTFDKDANGYVRAEGAGAIMLKPLSKAIADRDQVHAVIKGCTINHGGRVNSLTTPNPNAQAELIANTLEDAQVDPSTLSYIEMHGTGTALGDPIEINGIKKAFKDLSDKKGIKFEENPHCGIGSVKSNIGHLEAGAGMAGLLKVILSMKYKKIPGNIHLKEINPYIKLEDSPFYIVKDTIDWHRLKDQDNNEIPRRAGVSSFGFGGVNAHVVLEEYTNFPSDEIEEDLNSQVFVLSAKNEERLKEYAKNMSSFLKKTNHKGLKEICYTLQTGREAMEERLAIVVSSMEELIRKLEGYYLNNDETDIYRGHVNKGKTNHGKERNLEEKFVQDYSNSHGLYNLAQMWVTGNDIKWGVLHGEYIPKKLSLPTYPFKKKKYWMQTSTEINGEKNRSVTENQLGNENREKCSTNIGINNLNNMRANPQKEENLKLDKLFYTSVWAPKSTSVPKIGGASFLNFQRNKVLVVYSSQSLGMKDTLKKVHENDDFVSLDLKTDLRDPDEWIKKIGKLDIIYFLGGILTDVNELNDINMIENMQEQGVISLFRLVKSLIKFGYDHYSLKLKAFTNDVHKILPNESIKPYAAGINGLIKTISNEFSRWEVSCIDFCTEDIVNVKKDNSILIEHLLNELIDPSGGEVAIRGSNRYIRKISPITLPEVKHSPFRNQGVYLILGGAGGIGLEISHYLSRTVQAKLVLIGRSELNPRQKEKIKEIESLGGKVKYIQADALDIVSMNEAVRKGESEFGNINGVIHSAIVLNDKTLRNMEEEEFHSALEPKVQGSAILHHVLQEKALDFMMFFSSVQSFIGNEGQSNYAAACTFKDAYANYLSQKEQYPVKTINWGYWGSVGVVASEEYQKLMEDQGIYSIEPMEGIEAIQRVLDNNSQQIITIKAESKVLEDMGCDFGQQLELYPECMPSIFEETVGKLKNFIK